MLTIRLRRTGSKGRPAYRVVVSDSRLTPRGRVLDTLGWYDPKLTPKRFEFDLPKAEEWIGKGAQCSDTVMDFVKKERKRAKATA